MKPPQSVREIKVGDFWSEIKTDDAHAEELAVITHEGREFASGGFSIDMESGRMIAYVIQDKEPPEGFPYEPPTLWLTTWGGQRLARLYNVRGFTRGFGGTKLYHYGTLAPIAGFYWYGKGLGVGMMLRLKRGRKA